MQQIVMDWLWRNSYCYYSVAISGTVTLSGTGVEGAIVRIIQQDTDEEVDKQTTDSDGNYEFL